MSTAIQPTSSRQAHPRHSRAVVEDLYDVFRESRLNVIYYGNKLAMIQRWNLGIEITLAICASSALVSIPFIKENGLVLTTVFSIIAAILGVLKPILNLQKRIERASKLWSGYSGAFISTQSLVRRVKLHQSADVADERALQEIHDRMDTLCGADDPCPNKKEIDRLQDQVNAQYPVSEFWFPPKAA